MRQKTQIEFITPVVGERYKGIIKKNNVRVIVYPVITGGYCLVSDHFTNIQENDITILHRVDKPIRQSIDQLI